MNLVAARLPRLIRQEKSEVANQPVAQKATKASLEPQGIETTNQ